MYVHIDRCCGTLIELFRLLLDSTVYTSSGICLYLLAQNLLLKHATARVIPLAEDMKQISVRRQELAGPCAFSSKTLPILVVEASLKKRMPATGTRPRLAIGSRLQRSIELTHSF